MQARKTRVKAAPKARVKAAPEGNGECCYLLDLIEVKKEYATEFIRLMYRLTFQVFDDYGWKLIAAAQCITGRPNVVMHLWKIPSANSLVSTMAKLSDNFIYQDLQKCIVSERQNLLYGMGYARKDLMMSIPGDLATRALMIELSSRSASCGVEKSRGAERKRMLKREKRSG